MIDFIKVFWHCLVNSHRRVKLMIQEVDGRWDVYHYCECGYNDKNMET